MKEELTKIINVTPNEEVVDQASNDGVQSQLEQISNEGISTAFLSIFIVFFFIIMLI